MHGRDTSSGTPNVRDNTSDINQNPSGSRGGSHPIKDPAESRRKSILKRAVDSGARGAPRPSVSFAPEKEVVMFRILDKNDDATESAGDVHGYVLNKGT